MCSKTNDEDGCGGEEKERKTEVEVDGQCESDREMTVGQGDAKPGCVEATGQKHRPQKKSEKMGELYKSWSSCRSHIDLSNSQDQVLTDEGDYYGR